MKGKILTILVLITITITMLTGCKTTNKGKGKDGKNLTPGTYEGIGKGNNGDIKVKVTLTRDKIDKIEIVEEKETEGIKEPAIEKVPREIIDKQSLSVDTISGATWTSKGIIEAVEKALEAAGADVNKFKNKDGAKGTQSTFMIQRNMDELGTELVLEVINMGDKNNTTQVFNVSLPRLSYSSIKSNEVQGNSITRNSINNLLHFTD